MIRFERTALMTPGQFIAGTTFAKEIAEYVEARVGIKVTVFSQIGGTVGAISWQSEYDGLGKLEEVNATIMSDPDYLKKIAAAAIYFIPGQITEKIWMGV